MSITILDLFCGGGGAARGYLKELPTACIIGVDNVDHSASYPGLFIQADVIDYLIGYQGDICTSFDLIHASPPCQGYSPHTSSASSKWVRYSKGRDEPRLIDTLRGALDCLPLPYVIENVVGARDSMRNPVMLCGTMFGLPISRHRLFEANWKIVAPPHSRCSGIAKQYAEMKGWEYRDMSVTGKGRRIGTSDRWREILGIEDARMTQSELAECIPPAYTAAIARAYMDCRP